MRALLAALIASALVLLGWSNAACACEDEERGSRIIAACCCDDMGGAPCPGPCLDAGSGDRPSGLSLPPPAVDALAPTPTLPLDVPAPSLLEGSPALARGPPAPPGPLWLKTRSLRR